METFAKHSKRYLSGVQRITQRIEPCTCGCEGRDSWHAANVKRVVREIETFQEPHRSKTHAGYTATICAVGRYKHPSGWRPCGLTANKLPDGSWHCGGWMTLVSAGDYGTPETIVEKGEYVPWYKRPENQEKWERIQKEAEEGSPES